jgi:hypothetical protein
MPRKDKERTPKPEIKDLAMAKLKTVVVEKGPKGDLKRAKAKLELSQALNKCIKLGL